MPTDRKIWSRSDVEDLVFYYPTWQTSLIAKHLNRTVSQVYNKAFLLGLKKTEEYLNSEKSGRLSKLSNRGIGTRFKPGHVTWNKGKQGYMGANKTSFKKGNKPHNHKPVGSTRIDKDGYLLIKTAEPRKWELMHRHVWEKANGTIPKHSIVVFKDGNKLNCELANLQLISKAENMQRNTIQRFPEEIKTTIKAISKLKKTINNYGTK